MRLPKVIVDADPSIFLVMAVKDFFISLLNEHSISINDSPAEFLIIDICLTTSTVLKLLDQLGF